MTSILIACNDVVTARMAGIAIRSWEFARHLARAHRVTLAIPNADPPASSEFSVVTASRGTLRRLVSAHDVVIMQGPRLRPLLLAQWYRKPLVVDLCDPYLLEVLEASRTLAWTERQALVRDVGVVLLHQLRAGSFFVCASERQRDYWIGALQAVGRLTPEWYDRDPSLRRLIDVVPFGIPAEPPARGGPALRGVWPGIETGDKILLWGGGIWDWFDPATLIRAVARVRAARPEVKLCFLAGGHPNVAAGQHQRAVEARELARSLGLLDRGVFFNSEWVPYDRRQDYLLEADVGVSIHRDHLESHFSFRTRLLDCIWASLPIICTSGDVFADVVEREGLGLVVPPADDEQLATAIVRLVSDTELAQRCRSNVAAVAPRFRWSTVLRPLESYCADPHRAPDRFVPSRIDAAGLVAARLPGFLRNRVVGAWSGLVGRHLTRRPPRAA
jgi:glycosyltransferase involved in cell wall biosynthesis